MDDAMHAAAAADRPAEVAPHAPEDRTEANERRLHAVIGRRAAGLAPPRLAPSAIFRSFLIGGFECSTHRRRDGRRLDVIAGTSHDRFAAADYAALAGQGIRTARDGLRWHLIETAPGRYDWSSFLPMLRAARAAGVQVIWDLCHWGWPDGLDIWSEAFVERFAGFAAAAARTLRDESDEIPFYVPVNEISFWAWGGGSLGLINPCAEGRGDELKAILVRAAIAAVEAVRAVEPRARIVMAEPAINVNPRSSEPADVAAARAYTLSQFEACDMLAGRLRPELGGREAYLDVIGLNYYLHNQWTDGELPLALDDPGYRPFRAILADVHERYGRPVFVAETGIEGEARPAWLRVIAAEVAAARAAGVPVEGLCLYPVTDYPGWDDDRHCPTGLFGYADPAGARPLHAPLAAEVAALGGPAG
jgi:beta-glucosidase/6-phospho-beta-glucosidase/beta-galactosidase